MGITEGILPAWRIIRVSAVCQEVMLDQVSYMTHQY